MPLPQGSWDSHPNLTPERKPQPPLALLYLGARGTVSGLFQKTDKVTVSRGNRPELAEEAKGLAKLGGPLQKDNQQGTQAARKPGEEHHPAGCWSPEAGPCHTVPASGPSSL